MKGLVLSIGLITSISCYSQDRDTFQADSIYRINKVKSRTTVHVEAFIKQTEIVKYDKVGRVVELILTDESGIKAQNRTLLKYDNVNKLIAEDYYYGSIEGEKTKLEYDAKNRVVKKSTTYFDGKPKNEISITYDPLVENEKQYTREGKLDSEYQNYYETSNLTSKFTGTRFLATGQKESAWEYRYKNTFDKNGRLVFRRSTQGRELIQLMEYEYNDKGLLIKRTTKSDFAPPIIETFKYEIYQ